MLVLVCWAIFVSLHAAMAQRLSDCGRLSFSDPRQDGDRAWMCAEKVS